MLFSSSQPSMATRLVLVLALKASLVIAIILYAGIGLGPDEAQYWTWSQALDWGYYSKPPGIAWQIWIGTQLFGQSEWGVRSITVFLAMIQAVIVYRLALFSGLFDRTAFWCALFMAFSPFGMVGSLFAITDVGFLLCWTGACLTVVKALQEKKDAHPLHIGVWIAAGALFKWPIYAFWIFVFLFRRSIFSKHTLSSFVYGLLISMIGLLPSLWWNFSHDWATFRHVFSTVQGGSGHRASGNVFEFLASQMFLISPILFILLLCAVWQWFRKRTELPPQLYFCGFVTCASLSGAILVSCFQKIQGNWMTLAYPTGFIILGWDLFQQHPRRAWWGKMGIGLALAITIFLALLPSFYLYPPLLPYAPPYRLNPFKHNMGWNHLGETLTKMGYNPEKDFLFSDKYQTTSELSFYGPGQRRAYFLNLQGVRNNQFSYWPSLEENCRDKVGYFVWVENAPHLEKNKNNQTLFYQKELQNYFEKVELLGLSPLVVDGDQMVKGALIFRCEYCKNFNLPQSSLY